ncbi:MAG: DUF4249 domain-containing protein [Prolixibacteraceae bacterium]|nr:DUF4249 domain-containing protein [Prolixibacteraceae bacterium]
MKNKIKNKYKIIEFIFIVFLLSSCQELVTNDFPDFKSAPTVNSILVAGEPLAVHLSLADKLDSLPISFIENASVKLYIDSNFIEDLEYNSNGLYIANSIVEPGKEYKCLIFAPGYDSITVKQTIPSPLKIENIEHINIAGTDQEGISFPAIIIKFQNNPGKTSFFEISVKFIISYRDYKEERIAYYPIFTDPLILNEGLPVPVFNNETVEDSSYTLFLNYSTLMSSSFNGGPQRTKLFPIIVELRTLSPDYYHYKKQFYLYNEGKYANGITESMTASPLYSNVENGFGIFCGYSSFMSDTIIPEPYEN